MIRREKQCWQRKKCVCVLCVIESWALGLLSAKSYLSIGLVGDMSAVIVVSRLCSNCLSVASVRSNPPLQTDHKWTRFYKRCQHCNHIVSPFVYCRPFSSFLRCSLFSPQLLYRCFSWALKTHHQFSALLAASHFSLRSFLETRICFSFCCETVCLKMKITRNGYLQTAIAFV